MEDPWTNYFVNSQTGGSIYGYAGLRYQHGNGIFGKILEFLKPALFYLKREGVKTAKNIGNDLLHSTKYNLEKTGKKMMNDAIEKLTESKKNKDYDDKTQSGGGVKRRKCSKIVYKRRKNNKTFIKPYRLKSKKKRIIKSKRKKTKKSKKRPNKFRDIFG
jgi:hypothetical protein